MCAFRIDKCWLVITDPVLYVFAEQLPVYGRFTVGSRSVRAVHGRFTVGSRCNGSEDAITLL